MTDSVLAKLDEAFSYSFTDTEACLYADIDMATLYRYCDRNPGYAIKKEALKRRPNILAKRNLTDALKERDKETSKWWLERKAKDEFALRSEVTGRDGQNVPIFIVGGGFLPPNESITPPPEGSIVPSLGEIQGTYLAPPSAEDDDSDNGTGPAKSA